MQPLSSYSFADPKVMQDPYPYYERLRAEDPVHFDEGVHTWLVTRHEDIVAVARNTEVYTDEMRVSKSIRSPFHAEVEEYMQREGFMVLDPADSFKLDGELHTRRRKMVSHAFNGPAAAAMEARVAAICHERAAAFLGRAEADLVREYAMPIPILVICDALGLPMDHADEISRGADSMVAQVGAGATREMAYQHAHNVMQLHRFIRKAIDERRVKPGDDLISQIVHARSDDPVIPPLTDRELLSIATVALAGGVDTTQLRLLPWLHAKVPDAQEITLPLPVSPKAGGSSELFFIDPIIRNSHGIRQEHLVLRIEAAQHRIYEFPSIERQYRTLTALQSFEGVPLPAMHWMDADKTILGESFLVLEQVDGVVPNDRYHLKGLFFEAAPQGRRPINLAWCELFATWRYSLIRDHALNLAGLDRMPGIPYPDPVLVRLEALM